MTDSEAEAMLAALRKHYRQPVMPLRKYCEAFQAWARALAENEPATGDGSRRTDGLVAATDLVFFAIRKSNLLWRLLYAGEKVRTRKCPVHKGRWSGVSHLGTCSCQAGYNVTGWLPDGPVPESEFREPVTIVTLIGRDDAGRSDAGGDPPSL